MALILNIETATEICSVCIAKDGIVLKEKETNIKNSHSSVLTLQIEACLKEAGKSYSDLDAVAVSIGPGSYSGLRIGLSVAKGLCYALEIPLISVSTLQALAWKTQKETENQAAIFAPMIDARRMEVYTALYNGSNDMITKPHALILETDSFEEYFEKKQVIIFSGNGSFKYKDILKCDYAFFSSQVCSSTNMTFLSYQEYLNKSFLSLPYSAPFYLKKPNITKNKKRLI